MCIITGRILHIATGFQLSSICHTTTPNTAAIIHMMNNNDIIDFFSQGYIALSGPINGRNSRRIRI